MPESLPPYGDVFVDRSGHIWVSDYDPRELADTWTIFDPAGAAIARASIPRRLRIHEIGTDYVLGTESDDLDIEYVVVYPIRRATG